MQGRLYIIAGCSGVGKGTLLKLFREKNPEIKLSISATTRAPRPGEEHGVDYFFLTTEEFESMIAKDELVEYAKYVNNYYGTPKDKVEEKLASGHEVVLEIEVNGAMQVREKMKDAVFIFIAPPSYDALEKRLVLRGTERNEVIKERLDKAHREIGLATNYDYIVINDEVDNAADRIMAIIRAEHAKCSRTLDEYLKLMEETNND